MSQNNVNFAQANDLEEIFGGLGMEGFGLDDIKQQVQQGLCVNQNQGKAFADGAEYTSFHTNAALPLGAIQEIDKILMAPYAAKTRIVNDLVSAGCVISKDFGVFVDYYNRNDYGQAPTIAMDFVQEGEFKNAEPSKLDYDGVATPIPLIYKTFNITRRQLEAAQNPNSLHGSFDAVLNQVRAHSIAIAAAEEALVLNGNAAIGFKGQALTGILNNSVVEANSQDVTFDTTQPANFIQDVLEKGLQPLIDQYQEGPFIMYYSSNMVSAFRKDYVNQLPLRTVEKRLAEVLNNDGVDAPIRATNFLRPAASPNSTTTGTVVIMALTPNVINLLRSAQMRVAQYVQNDMISKFIVFSALAPRVMVDYDGRIGIQRLNVTLS